MFSSLPSASKIYVSSCKPKQKSVNSAKKKRKKVTASVCTPVRVYDEETLVSSSTLCNFSASQLSFNSHEESLVVEGSCNNGNELLLSGGNIHEINSIEGFIENKSPELNETKDSPRLSSYRNQSIESTKSNCIGNKLTDMGVEIENISALESGNIHCDEYIETDVQEIGEIQENHDVSESTENILGISTDNLFSSKDDEVCNKTSCDHLESTISEEVSSSLFTHFTVDDSTIYQSISEVHESTDNLNNPAISKIEEESECNYFADIKDTNREVNTDCNEVDLITSSRDIELNCAENGALSEISSGDVNKRKDSLGEKRISDVLDSSSDRSDCCASTNIFDIHVDNSEYSSVDENQNSNDGDCRMQSPEQSEVSCTESVMYGSKATSQSESVLQNSPVLAEKVYDKYAVLNSTDKEISNGHLPKNILDISYSYTNLQKVKSVEYLRRSLSLPENINTSRYAELCNNEMPHVKKDLDVEKALNKYKKESSKYCSTTDKSTFTIDKSNFTSNKYTITSDFVSSSNCKKDAATTPVKDKNFSVTENKSISTSFMDNTMLIMKVLPPVAIIQARARSYVFGSIGPTGSLLGNEELSRLFPDNKVTVFVGTWNMNGHNPPESIDDFLLPLDVSSVPDIYAIGVQESMQSRSEWEILLQTTLGPSHVLFASTSFGVLHLSIFMRRDLIWFCSEPEDANIATRPGSMIKTKGAVAICFMFFGTSFLFVNSHLTAHEQKLKERVSDYEKICSALDLPRQIPLKSYQKGKDVTSRFDCVFWCGDLNFRVVQDRPSVLSFVEEKFHKPQPNYNLLMKHDQLCQAMAKGVAFHGFKEGVINFIPSYKFDVGTSCFDSTKQRVPSYTDRILYRCRDKSSVVCMHYDAVPGIFTSDHKPVFAVYNVSIKPGRDNIPLAAGLFKREIYLEAIKRRAQQLEVSKNHKQSTICNIM